MSQPDTYNILEIQCMCHTDSSRLFVDRIEYDKLRGQLAAAEKDAERYRFLRNQEIADNYPLGWYVVQVKVEGGVEMAPARNKDDLDEAIDAAIAASREGKS